MRFLAWNVGHQARPKAISPQLTQAIGALAPDVIVLTEYVTGLYEDSLLHSLGLIGLEHALTTPRTPGENQVLIASRTPLEAGGIRAPAISPSTPSNALHVKLIVEGMDVLGIRIPDYSKQPRLRRACWDWIETVARAARERPFVMLGDFNTDPRYPPARCGDRIGRLVAEGWQHAAPLEGASFRSARGYEVRIDHAFVSRHFAIRKADYVWEIGSYALAGRSRTSVSDHAALLVDIARRPGAPGTAA